MKNKGFDAKKIKFILFIIFAVLSLVVVFFAGYLKWDIDVIKNLISMYYLLSILIYIILVAIAAATTLPISVIVAAGILIFSFPVAVLYAFIGILIGAYFVFLITRYSGKEFFKEYSRLKGGKLKAFNILLESNAFSFLMLLNFVYFFPSNLAHMVAGITNTKFSKFLFATAAGNFPNTFAVALFIEGLYKTNNIYIIISVCILILATAIPLYIYRKHMKDVIVLAFDYETYKKMKKAEKIIEKTEKIIEKYK